jgi:hypothetical protein
VSAQTLWQEVTQEGTAECYLSRCGYWERGAATKINLPCGDPPMLDACHLIPKHKLRQKFGREAAEVWEPILAVPGCRHHHTLFDNNRLRLARGALPAGFLERADELGFDWYIDRRFRVRYPDVAYCRSCQAPILWTSIVTPDGPVRKMPVDAEPYLNGNVALEERDGFLLARYVNGDAAGELYISHFQTCHDRKKWRNGEHG